MDQSARRMGLMIDGLYAVAQASRAPLRLQPVPLSGALAAARAAVAPREAGRMVKWRIDPALPTLQADPELLHQLLVQLLDNALKFTRGGAQPPSIEVRCIDLPSHGASGDAADCAAFAVTDNGIGFDNTRAVQLFGVFQRLHREADFDGVGTGLALCRAIAQRHGASITATGQLGAGCTVQVQWPRAGG
jgi:light-regulated signal transduction histidine kinase (bacteriophytochrome)